MIVAGCKQPAEVVEPRGTGRPNRTSEALVKECTVCHGTKESQRGPILNGMETWYLTDQLEKFRAGIRGKRASNRSEYLMGVGVQKIQSDFELAYLADWFAGQDPVPAIRTVKGDLVKGKKFYDQRCASCHGANGEGNRLVRGPLFAAFGGVVFFGTNEKIQSGRAGVSSFG